MIWWIGIISRFKKKTIQGDVRLIICSTDCKSDNFLEHRLHREFVSQSATHQLTCGNSCLVAQESPFEEWRQSARLINDVYSFEEVEYQPVEWGEHGLIEDDTTRGEVQCEICLQPLEEQQRRRQGKKQMQKQVCQMD